MQSWGSGRKQTGLAGGGHPVSDKAEGVARSDQGSGGLPLAGQGEAFDKIKRKNTMG